MIRRRLINLARNIALAIADLGLWAERKLAAMRPPVPRKRRSF